MIRRAGLFLFSWALDEGEGKRVDGLPYTISSVNLSLVALTAATVWGIVNALPIGWPLATMTTTIALIKLFRTQLARASTEQALDLLRSALGRFGVGEHVPRVMGGGVATVIDGTPMTTTTGVHPAAPWIEDLSAAVAEPAGSVEERIPETPAPAEEARPLDRLQRLLEANGIVDFSAAELAKPGRRHPSGVTNTMPPDTLWDNIVPTAQVLQWLRSRLGRPVIVSSGYRDPSYNAVVGGAAQSLHMAFNAADIRVEGVPPRALAAALLEHPRAEMISLGLYPGFLHVDTRALIGRGPTWRDGV